MIIGGLKAGTTSLKSYLNEHPEILGHAAVDMKYFREEAEYGKGYDAAFRHYFNEGDVDKSRVVVAKHAGTYLNPSDYKKIHDHNPDIKIIFIIRNPVERAYSNYNYEYSNGRISVSLEEVINNMDSDSKDSLLHQHSQMSLFPEGFLVRD